MVGYIGLYCVGYVYFFEVWFNGELVGGVYGVFIGCMFYGEFMFVCVSDVFKVVLVYLVFFLCSYGVDMIDC